MGHHKRNKRHYVKINTLFMRNEITFDSAAPVANTSNANPREVPQNNNGSLEGERKRVALDCEMVGVGRLGRRLILARVSIVDETGNVLLDSYVKPNQPVTDYKTAISGIRPNNLENAEHYFKVRQKAIRLLKGKIVIGHSLQQDLKLLNIEHPSKDVRDSALFHPLKEKYGNGQMPSLKRLTKSLLDRDIQGGEHDSVEDARAAMDIYNKLREEWEKYLKDDAFTFEL